MKWKCNLCEKLLSSKQNAAKHTKAVHNDSSITISCIKEDISSGRKITSNNAQVTAPNYFSGLNNVFSNNELVEDFSWGSRAEKNMSLPEVSEELTVQGINTSSLEHITVMELSEAGPSSSSGPQFRPPFKTSYMSREVAVNLPQPDSHDICETNSIESDTIRNIGSMETLDMNANSNLDLAASSSDDIINEDIVPPVQLTVTVSKRRGHCGSSSCVGCNRKPCGSCYNCLNKRLVR